MLNANNSSMNGTLIPQHMLNDISVNLRIRQEYFQQKTTFIPRGCNVEELSIRRSLECLSHIVTVAKD